jgi:signal peptidase I
VPLVRPGWLGSALLLGLLSVTATSLGKAIGARFLIQDRSMLPALVPGDRLLVSALSLRLCPPRTGDLVVFRDPERSGRLAIKRVAGLPGQPAPWSAGQPFSTGRGGEAGAAERLARDELLLAGDNLLESRDSRAYGPLSRRRLIGRAWYRYWPAERRGWLRPAPPRCKQPDWPGPF